MSRLGALWRQTLKVASKQLKPVNPMEQGGPRILTSFPTAKAVESTWNCYTDEQIGGSTRATLSSGGRSTTTTNSDISDGNTSNNSNSGGGSSSSSNSSSNITNSPQKNNNSLENHSSAGSSNRSNIFLRFAGNLSTELPASGNVVKSGYALARSKLLQPSLFGSTYHDVGDLNNALEVVCRGDGRTYVLNVRTDGLGPEDMFQAAIYTRGGPLWQRARVPFSDFLLTTMGYVQNEQVVLNPQKILTVGFLLSDGRDGPFQFDLKSITAVETDTDFTQMDVLPGE